MKTRKKKTSPTKRHSASRGRAGKKAMARTTRGRGAVRKDTGRTGTRIFHHIGLPTDISQPGEVYVADTKVWVTDPRRHPYRVEYLRFEPDSPVTGPLRNLPHVAFRVPDMDAALR